MAAGVVASFSSSPAEGFALATPVKLKKGQLDVVSPSPSQAADLCGLAKRIPAAIRTSPNEAENRRRQLARKALIHCVDYLCKNESKAPDVWGMISNGMLPGEVQDCSGDMFEVPPKLLRKVPTAWKAQWLAERSAKHLSLEDSKDIDANDENAINDIFHLIMKVTGNEVLPPQCQSKAVLAKVLDERYSAVKFESLGNWAHRAVKRDTMKIDWMVGGAYRINCGSDGMVTSITHRSSAVATLPDYITIDRSFVLDCPTSDANATLRKGIAVYKLIDLFASGTAPYKGLSDNRSGSHGNVWKSITVQAVAAVEEIRRRSQFDQSVGSEFIDHGRVRRQEALAKAKAGRAGDPSNAAKRRRSLSLGVPAGI